MATKPCQLVLIKRYPLDPKLRKDYATEYCAGFERNWVHYQSNAVLFNRSDVKRDVLPDLPTMPRHQIVVNGAIVETVFEMVELIEKKSFGWIIFNQFPDGGKQYLRQITPDDLNQKYHWFNSPFNTTLMDVDEKNAVLTKLREEFPESKFDAQELFTQ